MNSQHPTGSHNWLRTLQNRISTPSQKADYDDGDIAPVLREEEPDIEAKLDQVFGIDSRYD